MIKVQASVAGRHPCSSSLSCSVHLGTFTDACSNFLFTFDTGSVLGLASIYFLQQTCLPCLDYNTQYLEVKNTFLFFTKVIVWMKTNQVDIIVILLIVDIISRLIKCHCLGQMDLVSLCYHTQGHHCTMPLKSLRYWLHSGTHELFFCDNYRGLVYNLTHTQTLRFVRLCRGKCGWAFEAT